MPWRDFRQLLQNQIGQGKKMSQEALTRPVLFWCRDFNTSPQERGPRLVKLHRFHTDATRKEEAMFRERERERNHKVLPQCPLSCSAVPSASEAEHLPQHESARSYLRFVEPPLLSFVPGSGPNHIGPPDASFSTPILFGSPGAAALSQWHRSDSSVPMNWSAWRIPRPSLTPFIRSLFSFTTSQRHIRLQLAPMKQKVLPVSVEHSAGGASQLSAPHPIEFRENVKPRRH